MAHLAQKSLALKDIWEKNLPYFKDIYDVEKNLDNNPKKSSRLGPSKKIRQPQSNDLEACPENNNLQRLCDLGWIDEVLGEVKSGKEASVFLVRHQQAMLAAKVYKALEQRSFKNDGLYRQGRFIGDSRAEKAIAKRSHFGKQVQQSLWAAAEYNFLWQFFQAGLPVPKPWIGPESSTISESGTVVLMAFIGEGKVPAPRLSDTRLSHLQAKSAFEQSLAILIKLCKLDLVHGDFSTYNLLWHREMVVMIDVPQVVKAQENPNFQQLLERDIRSLCTSFRKLGVQHNSADVLRHVQQQAAI